jgi:hypothetical protein
MGRYQLCIETRGTRSILVANGINSLLFLQASALHTMFAFLAFIATLGVTLWICARGGGSFTGRQMTWEEFEEGTAMEFVD